MNPCTVQLSVLCCAEKRFQTKHTYENKVPRVSVGIPETDCPRHRLQFLYSVSQVGLVVPLAVTNSHNGLLILQMRRIDNVACRFPFRSEKI